MKLFKRHKCKTCKDTKKILVEIPVPLHEQSSGQRGYIWAFGGRVVKEEEHPCPDCN